MKQIICSLEDSSSQLGHSGIHLGGFNIYIIDSGLQKAIHIGQFLTVWSAKDKVSFEKLINTGQWIRSLTGKSMLVNYNKPRMDPTSLGPNSKKIRLEALSNAIQVPLDTGTGLWKNENTFVPMWITS